MTNKIFPLIAIIILIVGGAVYFGLREFVQLKNQLASLQEQVAPLLEKPLEEPIVPATSTPISEPEPEPEPEPETDINPCDSLNCDNLDGWNNSGSISTCQDEEGKTCDCQTQIYYNYSCSSSKQKCVYSIGNTRISKNNCVAPEPESAQYPDLIVKLPSFSPAVPIKGDEMAFWATLKNQGAGPAASSLSYLRIDGVKFTEFSTVSLASNESIVVTGSAVWPALAGGHKLEVCADGALQVIESNELNNCTEITFTVAEKEIIKQPDLIIQSLSMSPASTTVGGSVTFAGVVKNRGEASANQSLALLKLDLSNNGSWDEYFGTMLTNALEIDAIRTVTWFDAWTAAVGTHKFEICADVDFEVAESDETNNCLSQVFTVP